VSPPSHLCRLFSALRAYDNIPVVSYVVLRGRCRACGARIPLVTRCSSSDSDPVRTAAWRLTSAWPLPAYCVLLAAAVVGISAIDVEHMRISTLVYSTAVLARRCSSSPRPAPHRWSRVAGRAHRGRSPPFAAFFTLFFRGCQGIGFGDVRLAGLCGGFLGWMAIAR